MPRRDESKDYPNFSRMTDGEAKEYITEYIETRFKTRGRLLGKLPYDLREDAKQSIFIDLYEKRFSYDKTKGMFSTFAYYRGMGIVSRFMTDVRQQNSKVQMPTELIDVKSNVSDQWLNKENLKTLIRRLNRTEKAVFFLRFVEKTKIHGICNQLGLGKHKVEIIIKRIQSYLN